MLQTKQRDAILDVLQEAKRPLTRDEILSLARKKIPRLGSSTVNLAIRKFSEAFNLVGVDFPGQPRRYELPSDREHPHFICRKCNRVYDLDCVMQLPPLRAPKGYIVTGGEVIYTGICGACNQ
ncbi:MAG: Fur family transcriptional regulator [Opitutales bacterium]